MRRIGEPEPWTALNTKPGANCSPPPECYHPAARCNTGLNELLTSPGLRAGSFAQLALADGALERLPQRPQVGVIRRVVASLRHRLHFDLPRHAAAGGGASATLAELRPAEAGECDCCEPCGGRRRREKRESRA